MRITETYIQIGNQFAYLPLKTDLNGFNCEYSYEEPINDIRSMSGKLYRQNTFKKFVCNMSVTSALKPFAALSFNRGEKGHLRGVVPIDFPYSDNFTSPIPYYDFEVYQYVNGREHLIDYQYITYADINVIQDNYYQDKTYLNIQTIDQSIIDPNSTYIVIRLYPIIYGFFEDFKCTLDSKTGLYTYNMTIKED